MNSEPVDLTRLPSPIAIDGPAASGKSTLGKTLAERFGYRFLDTGLMYRAFTLAALREGVPAEKPEACGELAQRLQLDVTANSDTRILLGGEDVTDLLRTAGVEANVSAYSAIPAVREVMVRKQREVAGEAPSVLAGRDIGTAVLPDAPLKLYLEASEDARAERRARQSGDWGQAQQAADSQQDIRNRDHVDSSRKNSPLRPADDAIRIDTTNLTLDQVIGRAVGEVLQRQAPLPRPVTTPADTPQPGPRSAAGSLRATARKPIASLRSRVGWNTFVPPFYWFCVHGLRVILVVVGRWKAVGRENIPASGGLIVVSNHLSNADPPILASGIARRRVRFMAKIELFKMPFGAVVRLYGAFAVRRFDADLAAMLNAERLLKRGEVLGMFPEGTRSRTGKLGRPHPGTAVIALRSGAPVLPCAIIGTEQLSKPLNLLKKPRIQVLIGEPIEVAQVRRPTEEQVSELTERIFAAIKTLLPEKYLPAYTEADGPNTSSE